jgi:hypothetical protein
MPATGNPSAGDVHVNVPLTTISVAYIQDQANFVADRVFANVPVMKQSDRYYTYNRGDFNRDEMQERAPGTESAGAGYDIDNTPTYFCTVYAFNKPIPDPIRANSDAVLSPDRDATIFVTQKALIKREVTFAKKYFQAGVWDYGSTGVSANPEANEFLQWNNDNSTPIQDIRTAKRTVQQATGFKPNIALVGKLVFDILIDHPEFVDRIKYNFSQGVAAVANEQIIAQLFGLDEVLVMEAVYNTAPRGEPENSQFIGGPNLLLAYRTKTPGIMVPSAGYTFSWNGWMGATGMGHRIKTFRWEIIESDICEVQMAYDQKMVSADLGFMFSSAVYSPVSGSSI